MSCPVCRVLRILRNDPDLLEKDACALFACGTIAGSAAHTITDPQPLLCVSHARIAQDFVDKVGPSIIREILG